MAWIESHQELVRHPKTRRFVRLTGISLPAAVGHLHMLWWWALDYAQNGELTEYTPEDIADAVLWESDPCALIDALVGAGFLERDESRLFIHDWREYAGKLLDRRAADRERKRKPADSDGVPADSDGVPADSDGVPTDSIRNSNPYRNPNINQKPKEKDQDLTRETSREAPPSPNPEQVCDIVCEPESETDDRPEQSPYITPCGTADTLPSRPGEYADSRTGGDSRALFADFWDVYPRKVGKSAAEKSWQRAMKGRGKDGRVELSAAMIAAVEMQKQGGRWRDEGGRYIPNPATWLNQGRWQDDPSAHLPRQPSAGEYNDRHKETVNERNNRLLAAYFGEEVEAHDGAGIAPVTEHYDDELQQGP